jgi:tRNA A37 threonylcarbamoyladenosine synthetase subunit TsaC/SUA5/YrdC
VRDGVASTVIDVTTDGVATVLRTGALDAAEVLATLD